MVGHQRHAGKESSSWITGTKKSALWLQSASSMIDSGETLKHGERRMSIYKSLLKSLEPNWTRYNDLQLILFVSDCRDAQVSKGWWGLGRKYFSPSLATRLNISFDNYYIPSDMPKAAGLMTTTCRIIIMGFLSQQVWALNFPNIIHLLFRIMNKHGQQLLRWRLYRIGKGKNIVAKLLCSFMVAYKLFWMATHYIEYG